MGGFFSSESDIRADEERRREDRFVIEEDDTWDPADDKDDHGRIVIAEPLADYDWFQKLREFFDAEVTLQNAAEYKSVFMPNVESLYRFVNQNDPRFSHQVIEVGSMSQGLKVHLPDEFDFNIHILGIGQGRLVKERAPRHYDLTFDGNQAETDTISTGGNVVWSLTPVAELKLGEDFVNLDERETDKRIWTRRKDLVRFGDLVPYLVLKQLHRLLRRGAELLPLNGKSFIRQQDH